MEVWPPRQAEGDHTNLAVVCFDQKTWSNCNLLVGPNETATSAGQQTRKGGKPDKSPGTHHFHKSDGMLLSPYDNRKLVIPLKCRIDGPQPARCSWLALFPFPKLPICPPPPNPDLPIEGKLMLAQTNPSPSGMEAKSMVDLNFSSCMFLAHRAQKKQIRASGFGSRPRASVFSSTQALCGQRTRETQTGGAGPCKAFPDE